MCITRRLEILTVFATQTSAMAHVGRKLEEGVSILIDIQSDVTINVRFISLSWTMLIYMFTEPKMVHCKFSVGSTPVDPADGLPQPLLCMQCTARLFNPW